MSSRCKPREPGRQPEVIENKTGPPSKVYNLTKGELAPETRQALGKPLLCAYGGDDTDHRLYLLIGEFLFELYRLPGTLGDQGQYGALNITMRILKEPPSPELVKEGFFRSLYGKPFAGIDPSGVMMFGEGGNCGIYCADDGTFRSVIRATPGEGIHLLQ